MPAQFDVIQDGHSAEEFDLLEGPGDSQGCDAVGFQGENAFPLKKDLSLLGPVVSVDAVEQAGLPRSIRADDGQDLPGLHAEAYLVQNLDSAERKIQTLNFEKGISTLYSHRFLRLYRFASW